MKTHLFENPTVVSSEKWLAARRELLREEKKFTQLRDQLAARRRELPWVKVDKSYEFASPTGRVALADLFEDRSQLVVYHFMLGPGWGEGCKSCAYVADHLAPAVVHLHARDVAFAAISRAPLAEIASFKERMGWAFNWVSSHDNDFNYDYRVSFTPEEFAKGKVDYNYDMTEFPSEEAPGLSVFARAKNGEIYHTYSTYARGLDVLIGTYTLLDLVPKGRDEGDDTTMSWVRYHDSYDQPADVVATH
jgi:predicted dithiol-disulfide oxidoreductase (DUF899 family)